MIDDSGSAVDPPPADEVPVVPEAPPVAEAPSPEPAPEPEQVVEEVVTPEPVQEVSPAPQAPAASSSSSTPVTQPKTSARERMLTVVRARKAERLEKIMEMAREKRVITNDDVEKLLKVSNATATRYLNALVLAGRLRRFGARKHEKYESI